MSRISEAFRRFSSSPINYILYLLNKKKAFDWISNDQLFIKLKFRAVTGKSLDLVNPQTFSEKLQWLKLYDRNPRYTDLVDKYKVKKIVAKLIGEDFIIPTLGIWDKPEEIDWDLLPNQFVLKTTHGGGSGGVIICQDKASFNYSIAIEHLRRSMKQDIYREFREWPYKNVPHRIIAEKYLDPSPDFNDLHDYKFFCFNGEPRFCQVISGRNTQMCVDFFDSEWKHLNFHEPANTSFAEIEPSKPHNLELMWNTARVLAYNKAFSRIDFYDLHDHVYFGEITFFPTSGMGGFSPSEYDIVFGRMISLPRNAKQ